MTIGSNKGKSAIKINREIIRHKRQFTEMIFDVPGYWVSTIGLDEAAILEYLKNLKNLKQTNRHN
jgi:hypothetical protein